MPSNVVLIGLIFIVTSSWAIAVEPSKPDIGRVSSAVLPPLPDLPIPGTSKRVTGGQEVKAATAKESMEKNDRSPVSNHDLTPSPLVFGNTPEGQLVF